MAASSSSTFSPSILLKSEQTGPGEFKVTQLENPPPLAQVANDGDRIPIDFNIEIIRITGYVDTGMKEICIVPTILGIPGTTYYASLSKGLSIDFELVVGRGKLGITVGGKDLNVNAAFNGRFGIGSFNKQAKIMTLP